MKINDNQRRIGLRILCTIIFCGTGGWIAFELYGLPGESSLSITEEYAKSKWKGEWTRPAAPAAPVKPHH